MHEGLWATVRLTRYFQLEMFVQCMYDYSLKKSALILIYCFHSSGVADSSKMAVTGQAGSHAPQSMHSSGSMYNISAVSNPSSFCVGWMQSTGQTSTQDASFTPIHG